MSGFVTPLGAGSPPPPRRGPASAGAVSPSSAAYRCGGRNITTTALSGGAERTPAHGNPHRSSNRD